MRPFFPWKELVIFGGFGLLTTICAIVVLFLDVPWGAHVAMWLTAVSSDTVAVLVVRKKLSTRPDYRNETFGVWVWTGGVPELNSPEGRQDLHNAFGFFVDELPGVLQELFLPNSVEAGITTDELRRMIRGMRLEWTQEPIRMLSRLGWTIKDSAGLQSGASVKVQWLGSAVGGALYHELFHMIDELLLGRSPDYDHSRVTWWDVCFSFTAQANFALRKNRLPTHTEV